MGGGSSKDQAAAASGGKATGDTANGKATGDRSPHTTRSQLMQLSRAVNNYAIAQYQVAPLDLFLSVCLFANLRAGVRASVFVLCRTCVRVFVCASV